MKRSDWSRDKRRRNIQQCNLYCSLSLLLCCLAAASLSCLFGPLCLAGHGQQQQRQQPTHARTVPLSLSLLVIFNCAMYCACPWLRRREDPRHNVVLSLTTPVRSERTPDLGSSHRQHCVLLSDWSASLALQASTVFVPSPPSWTFPQFVLQNVGQTLHPPSPRREGECTTAYYSCTPHFSE